ncbi:MAG TPA: hypothetical protein VFO76_10445, partial [Candidatus Kapabacteria bacterium]|nr:hypothetical protein [Candidatus Kapabacteria bacterium]
MKRAVVTIIIFLLSAIPLAAQWKNVAPNIFTIPASGGWGGVITYQNGNLWAAYDKIYFSPDLGKTWILRSPASIQSKRMYDLSFYDDNIGIVVTGYPDNKILLTRDQGRSWNDITPSAPGNGSYAGVCFAGSPTNIVINHTNGSVFTSMDQGVTWKNIQLATCVFDVESGNKGTVYAITGNLFISRDFGITWQQQAGTFDWDSYSFERDRCDTNTFYVSNEEIVAPIDYLSSIFVSTNSGASWSKKRSLIGAHYCGSIATTPGAVFAQSRLWIERSTNKGDTWKVINGPPNTLDTRTIAAVSENTIFAMDSLGSIWATFNSGGDSLNIAPNGSLSISPRQLFTADTVFCDGLITKQIVISPGGCQSVLATSCRVKSTDSANYIVDASGLPNKIFVTLIHGTVSGSHQGSLIVTLSDGTFDTVSLGGYSIAPKLLSIFSTDQVTDTIGGPVHIPITITGLDKPQDIELVLHYENGLNAQYDGSYSIAGTQLDIPGNTWGGRSKLLISGAVNNTILGYANFTVYADSFAAPKVWFDSLRVITSVSPCEYSALPATVNIITPPSGCGTSTISKFMRTGRVPTFIIYPNPTNGVLMIKSSRSIETEIT